MQSHTAAFSLALILAIWLPLGEAYQASSCRLGCPTARKEALNSFSTCTRHTTGLPLHTSRHHGVGTPHGLRTALCSSRGDETEQPQISIADMRFKLEVADQIQRLYEARKEVSSSLEDLIHTSGTIISHRNSISSTEIADIGLSVAHSDLALSKAIVEIMKVKAALAAIGYEQAGGDLSTIQWDNKDYS